MLAKKLANQIPSQEFELRDPKEYWYLAREAAAESAYSAGLKKSCLLKTGGAGVMSENTEE